MKQLMLSILLLPALTAAVSAQAPSTTSAAPAPAAVDYIIGPQDVLKVLVFDEPTLSGTYRVDNDGSFQYPFLGRVAAAGLSLRQVEQALARQLETGFVRRAQVSVEVDQFRSRSVFVIGEVRTPGKYPMTGQMTLIEALAAAGSVTQNAGGDVLILSPADGGIGESLLTPEQQAKARVQRVNLNDLQLGNIEVNVGLKEGDTIFVTKAEKFYVTGQVKSPGAFTFERNLTVLQALSLAGGITDKGSNRRMKVVRVEGGKTVERGISLTDLVQPGDTIVVASRLL